MLEVPAVDVAEGLAVLRRANDLADGQDGLGPDAEDDEVARRHLVELVEVADLPVGRASGYHSRPCSWPWAVVTGPDGDGVPVEEEPAIAPVRVAGGELPDGSAGEVHQLS